MPEIPTPPDAPQAPAAAPASKTVDVDERKTRGQRFAGATALGRSDNELDVLGTSVVRPQRKSASRALLGG